MSSLYTFHDVMYGPLDLSDAEGYDGMIMKILSSASMSRLKNIKQIGFANNFYVSADHTRFTHALGTLHVAKRIVRQIFKNSKFIKKVCKDVEKYYSQPFCKKMLKQHIYIAALLQDVGEFPQQQATKRFFSPTAELRSSVSEDFELNSEKLTAKQVFTLACLVKDSKIKEALKDKINNRFLAFLITGAYGKKDNLSKSLQAIRQILDGVVDADRLDYVARDSYHTVGVTSGIDSVIKSLIRYDSNGPVFDSPEPILWFLKQRGMLYHSVYLSPAYRIRKIVTMSLLSTIRNNADYAKFFFSDFFSKSTAQWRLSYKDFIYFDDTLFSRQIEKFRDEFNNGDENSLVCALKILSSPQNDYSQQWVTCGQVPSKSKKHPENFPSYFFYDTYRDLYNYTTFKDKEIKIESPSFELIGSKPLYLEDIGGPIGTSLNNFTFRAPIERAISVFYPTENKTRVQQTLTSIQAGNLVKTLYEKDPLEEDIFDTRKLPGFCGPTYFISYALEDINRVLMLATYLHSKRVRYVIRYDRGGQAGIMKSLHKDIKSSDKAILFLTETYLAKVKKTSSYVYKEVKHIRKFPNNAKFFVTLEDMKVLVRQTFNCKPFKVKRDPAIKIIKSSDYRNPFQQIDEFLNNK